MSAHIPFLSALVLICAAFPTQLVRVAVTAGGGLTTAGRERLERWGLPVAAGAVALLAWWTAPLPGLGPLPASLVWPLIAAAAGLLAPLWEIGLGYAWAFARRRRVARVALHERASVHFGAMASVCLVAVAEELVFRRLGIELLAGLDRPLWTVVALTSIVYGLNHLYFGWPTVAQKTLTGAAYAGLYIAGGHSLLVPVIAHVVHNLVVLGGARWLGGRR